MRPGTLAALKARRKEVFEPLVAKHQGRVFKVTGDGVLVDFGSAVNAVQCAVDLQHGMAAANSDLPEARHIVLRIGVNLGDVIVEGSDLYGDGINIAARLESIAEPGGIAVSGTAFDQVKNKIEWSSRILALKPEEYCGAGARLSGNGNAARIVHAQSSNRQAFHRSAALHQHERRSGTGVFFRWHHGGHHYRPVENLRPPCCRPQHRVHLQEQANQGATGRTGTRGQIRARGQRPQGRLARSGSPVNLLTAKTAAMSGQSAMIGS